MWWRIQISFSGGRYVYFILYLSNQTNPEYNLKEHTLLYPTLARISLDILPCQASSVPCERLFSASKQTAENRRASLGPKRFEELQVMKFAWRGKIENLAARNSQQMEEVDLDLETRNFDEYIEMLDEDESAAEFDKLEDEFVLLEDPGPFILENLDY